MLAIALSPFFAVRRMIRYRRNMQALEGLDDRMLHECCRQLELRFKIRHATLQIEAGDTELACRLAPAHIV